jgi:DNA-binding transcriptional regulator PaaX
MATNVKPSFRPNDTVRSVTLGREARVVRLERRSRDGRWVVVVVVGRGEVHRLHASDLQRVEG